MRRVGQEVPITRDLLSGWAVLDRRTIHVRDMRAAAARRRYPGLNGLRHLRTMLAAPLLHEGVAVGLIIIDRSRVRPFTAKQIALLQTFADQAVIALENVRLVQGAGGAEPRPDRSAGAADGDQRDPPRRSAARRPTCQPIYRDDRAERHATVRGEDAAVFLFDGEVLRTVAH